MRCLTYLLPVALLACGPGQEPAAPAPPSEPDAPIAPPPFRPGSARAPLEGCTAGPPGPATSWACGPHRIVIARFEQGLPPNPDTIVRNVGEAEISETPLEEQMLTVVARHVSTNRVVSCRLDLREARQASDLRAWCDHVVEHLITAP